MKPRRNTEHPAPELMREFGADVLEEKRVYGQGAPKRKRQPRIARPKALPGPRS